MSHVLFLYQPIAVLYWLIKIVNYAFNKKHHFNDTIIAQILIDNKGIAINMKHHGMTCLMNAWECSNLEMVQFLVSN